MSRARIVASGVYTVVVDETARRAAIDCHGNTDLVKQELASVALVELEVRGAPRPPDLEKWHQWRLKHVPYDEVYFSLDRSTILARQFGDPGRPDFALAFYLHFFDPARPMKTEYGIVELPAAVSQRPSHLRGLRYSYWD